MLKSFLRLIATVVHAKFNRESGCYELHTSQGEVLSTREPDLQDTFGVISYVEPIEFPSRWEAYRWALASGYLPRFLA